MLPHHPVGPPIPLICHHDHTSMPVSECVPRRLTVRKIDPELCMLVADSLEMFVGESELHGAEDEVHIDPVVGLLVEGRGGEGVTDVENVAIDILLSLPGNVFRECMYRC
jgi:hypothetical protein